MNQETDTIECFECDGRGVLLMAFRPGTLSCPACRGTKRLAKQCEKWRVIGREMWRDRIARRVGLREEAKARGMDIDTLSRMERGLIEPQPAKPTQP